MNLLKISAIPPGAVSSSPATYNEADANPYPNLPDPLTLKNGQKVTTAAVWRSKRRAELLEDFQREIYGRTPKTPEGHVVGRELDERHQRRDSDRHQATARQGRQLVVSRRHGRDTGDVEHAGQRDGPVPVIILFGGGGFPPAAGAAAPPNPCAPPGGFGARARWRWRPSSGGRRSRPWRAGGPDRADMAAAGSGERMGLREPQHRQRAGRLRRGTDVRHHRPRQQGPAARAR